MSALSIAVVTETHPPEVNGVAMTVGRLIEGLRGRGHRVSVLRPRQSREDRGGEGDLLLAGLPMPGHAGLRFGLPAGGALARAWRARRPDVVHVVTEGPLGWSAVAAARRLGLPVTSGFHTNFDRYSVHYASADLFLFGSLTETYGNVVAEAMASGLAVVAYRSAAAAELIDDGFSGRSVPPGDEIAFVAAALGLAMDDDLRRAIGRRARLDMETRGWPAVVERFEGVLRQAARSPC